MTIAKQWYDREQGLVDRAIYHDPDIFELEMTHIFGRCWLFVGHVSQIPEPDDYITSRMGRDRVILTRDRQGGVHVLLNTCRHKGMRVVRYDQGNTRVFTCPYHGWGYSTTGTLVEVPGQLVALQRAKKSWEYGGAELDRKCWGLLNARTEIYKGAVFATWDEDAPSLADYLGDMKYYFDVLLDGHDGSEGETELVGGILKWRIKANWKAAAENHMADGLHNVSHKSTEVAMIGPGGRVEGVSRHGVEGKISRSYLGDVAFVRFGHAVLGPEPYVVTEEAADPFPQFATPVGPLDNPDVCDAYYRDVFRRRRERLMGRYDAIGPVVIGGVFPNMGFHATFPRSIVVYHPVSPTETEAWRVCVVDRKAPPEVRAMVRHHLLRYAGPAGMNEQDDMDNWHYLTEASSFPAARDYPYNDQARMRAEEPSEVMDGAVVTRSPWSEGPIRGFLNAWNRHLLAPSWSEYLDA